HWRNRPTCGPKNVLDICRRYAYDPFHRSSGWPEPTTRRDEMAKRGAAKAAAKEDPAAVECAPGGAAPIVAFKGFDANFQCRGFQYEVGKTYTHDGAVVRCASGGFHACEFPLDVFDYYPPSDSRYAMVKASGSIDRGDGDDTKFATASLEIVAELRIPDIVSRTEEWILARVDSTKKESNTGDQSAAINMGYRSAATNMGNRSVATNMGYQSAATNMGHQSAAINTGEQSAATNMGNRSVATNTGSRSAATNMGDRSAAINTGNRSAAEVSGTASVAIATGAASKARAGVGGAIVLVNRGAQGNIRHIRSAKVGDGIKADVWYSLGDDGEFVEAE